MSRLPQGSRGPWRLLGLCLVLMLALGGATACGNDDNGNGNASPRGYIGSHYTRARNLDEANNGTAYTAGKAPTGVADEIARAASPMDRRTAAVGGNIFLQYRDDIIAIMPNGTGSKILVDDYGTGYRRHHSSVSVFGWPSDNTSFRGGSSGSSGGK